MLNKRNVTNSVSLTLFLGFPSFIRFTSISSHGFTMPDPLKGPLSMLTYFDYNASTLVFIKVFTQC